VANSLQILPTFPPPSPLIPYGGFSPVRLEASLGLGGPSASAFDHQAAVHPFRAFHIPASGTTAKPTGPWLGTVYHPRTCNRYYGLMRQSDELRPAWLIQLTLSGLCPLGAVRLTFPSLPCHTIHACRYLYPVGCPSSFDGSIPRSFEPSPFLSRFGCSDLPFSLASEKEAFSRRQFSRYVAACTFARAADQSPPTACAADRPARLRQSLPQPGSPPTGVCYHYSAQPSLAEAGLSPASMSKIEGCT